MVLKVIANGVRWAAPTPNTPKITVENRPKPIEDIPVAE
jgi:hypothetical protein